MPARKGNTTGKSTWFKPGQSGNPGGSRNAGAYVSEMFNALCDKTLSEIRHIVSDSKAPISHRVAAKQWLETMSDPDKVNPGAALDRIFDRTSGKPTQVIETTGDLKVKSYGIDPKRIGSSGNTSGKRDKRGTKSTGKA